MMIDEVTLYTRTLKLFPYITSNKDTNNPLQLTNCLTINNKILLFELPSLTLPFNSNNT